MSRTENWHPKAVRKDAGKTARERLENAYERKPGLAMTPHKRSFRAFNREWKASADSEGFGNSIAVSNRLHNKADKLKAKHADTLVKKAKAAYKKAHPHANINEHGMKVKPAITKRDNTSAWWLKGRGGR